MLKPYSTKRPRPIAPEFARTFIEGGWARVNLMYGKRCSVRWFKASGPRELRQQRDAYLASQRMTAAHDCRRQG